MGVQCAVPNCRNASLRTSINEAKKKISYHQFPKDEHYKKLWISKCYRSTPYNYDNAYMCSEHFSNDDFVRDVRSELLHVSTKRKLKPNAIPSRLLGTPIVIEKLPEETRRKKRYGMRKRNAPVEEVSNESNETTTTLAKPVQVKSSPLKEDKIEATPPPKKKVLVQDDEVDTEENLQKILNIVLERIHCLEQELEGLTHIMEDIKGRIEKIQSRY